MTQTLEIGQYGLDTRDRRVGEVIDIHAGVVTLLSLDRQEEWTAPALVVQRATTAQELTAKLAVRNEAGVKYRGLL